MKQYRVKDLTVPISEYATVPLGSTLAEAVIALEKAQEEYAHTQYSHRAVLVLDKQKQVVGKLSQLDFLRSLEPQDEKIERIKDIAKVLWVIYLGLPVTVGGVLIALRLADLGTGWDAKANPVGHRR